MAPPSRAGKKWSNQEKKQAVDAFARGKTIQEIATIHERTPAAVIMALRKAQVYEKPVKSTTRGTFFLIKATTSLPPELRRRLRVGEMRDEELCEKALQVGDNRSERMCLWVVRGKERGVLYCPNMCVGRSSYCEEHRARAIDKSVPNVEAESQA
jgi:transposase-like protein